MTARRIVYTRPDGGVSVCAPSLTALAFMCHGGGRWGNPGRGFLDRQIAEQSKYGVGERAAHRFVTAMQNGGCTTAEAYAIMRDRFCAHLGTGCELWDAADMSIDRWFRDAWVRSHNGGPIDIDLSRAKPIQWRRIRRAVDAENARRSDELDACAPLEIDIASTKSRIRSARSVAELRRIWPL